MKTFFIALAFLSALFFYKNDASPKIFDVHIHGSNNPSLQIKELKNNGVYKVAISSSWKLQNEYKNISETEILYGLMFPCPDGKVPYSLQPCYENSEDFPSVSWVEEQIKAGRIHFIGEVLNQYYGISPSDTLLYPYYKLALKYNIPVGIHTGSAGPNHGSKNFKEEMGKPLLLKEMLSQFPDLKLWIMHGGDQYYKEAIEIMKAYKQVYADISVIANPDIVPPEQFYVIMKSFLEAGLEGRLMFGSDNGNIEKIISAVEALDFLSFQQKNKLYHLNAAQFFSNGE